MVMRKLSWKEIATVEKNGAPIAKIEIEGTTGCVPVFYQILVIRCKFKPDGSHKDEAASNGYSSGYIIGLFNVTENSLQDTKFFTQCTESEVFVHVGNYMATTYMLNNLIDGHYLNGFDTMIDS
jgi:hypothetical protein